MFGGLWGMQLKNKQMHDILGTFHLVPLGIVYLISGNIYIYTSWGCQTLPVTVGFHVCTSHLLIRFMSREGAVLDLHDFCLFSSVERQ